MSQIPTDMLGQGGRPRGDGRNRALPNQRTGITQSLNTPGVEPMGPGGFDGFQKARRFADVIGITQAAAQLTQQVLEVNENFKGQARGEGSQAFLEESPIIAQQIAEGKIAPPDDLDDDQLDEWATELARQRAKDRGFTEAGTEGFVRRGVPQIVAGVVSRRTELQNAARGEARQAAIDAIAVSGNQQDVVTAIDELESAMPDVPRSQIEATVLPQAMINAAEAGDEARFNMLRDLLGDRYQDAQEDARNRLRTAQNVAAREREQQVQQDVERIKNEGLPVEAARVAFTKKLGDERGEAEFQEYVAEKANIYAAEGNMAAVAALGQHINPDRLDSYGKYLGALNRASQRGSEMVDLQVREQALGQVEQAFRNGSLFTGDTMLMDTEVVSPTGRTIKLSADEKAAHAFSMIDEAEEAYQEQAKQQRDAEIAEWDATPADKRRGPRPEPYVKNADMAFQKKVQLLSHNPSVKVQAWSQLLEAGMTGMALPDEDGNVKVNLNGFNLFKRLNTLNPRVLSSHANDDILSLYQTADLLERTGSTPENALQEARRAYDAVQRGDVKLDSIKTSQLENITGELADGWFWNNAANTAEIKAKVARLASQFQAVGRVDNKTAVEAASKRIQASHTIVNGWLINTSNKRLPPNINELATTLAEDYAREYGEEEGVDADDLTLVPEGEGTFVLRNMNTLGTVENMRDFRGGIITTNSFMQMNEEARKKAIKRAVADARTTTRTEAAVQDTKELSKEAATFVPGVSTIIRSSRSVQQGIGVADNPTTRDVLGALGESFTWTLGPAKEGLKETPLGWAIYQDSAIAEAVKEWLNAPVENNE